MESEADLSARQMAKYFDVHPRTRSRTIGKMVEVVRDGGLIAAAPLSHRACQRGRPKPLRMTRADQLTSQ